MQQNPDPAHVQQMMTMLGPIMVLFGLVMTALVIIPFWVIFKKAGLGGPLSLLMIIPGVGIVMLYVLAFSRWKVVPAVEFAAGYPPAYPPPGYAPVTPPAYVQPPADPSERF